MRIPSFQTRSISAKEIQKEWLLVDAKDQILGRLASQVAAYLRGKHKPNYVPHLDCGDHVVVINAAHLRLTGKKWAQKEYIRHTGYPGGQRSVRAKDVRDNHPERLIEYAVRGMLAKNKLGRQHFRNLHVYGEAEHAHVGQDPKVVRS